MFSLSVFSKHNLNVDYHGCHDILLLKLQMFSLQNTFQHQTYQQQTWMCRLQEVLRKRWGLRLVEADQPCTCRETLCKKNQDAKRLCRYMQYLCSQHHDNLSLTRMPVTFLLLQIHIRVEMSTEFCYPGTRHSLPDGYPGTRYSESHLWLMLQGCQPVRFSCISYMKSWRNT